MRMVHLAAPIAATGRAAAQSPPDYFLRPARRAALIVNATPMVRPNARQRQFRPGDLWFRRPRTTAPASRPSALHTFDYGQSCKLVATPTHLFSEILGGPILKRLPWSVTCLSPMRQGELLATQNPDGSLVFSAVLKDEQGLLSFLLVPPSPQRTPPGPRHAARASRLWDPAARSVDVLHSNPDGNRETLSRA
jgi:hypothetical protein